MFAGSWIFYLLFDGLKATEGHLVLLLAICWLGCAACVFAFASGLRSNNKVADATQSKTDDSGVVVEDFPAIMPIEYVEDLDIA